jgi:hypothetical protein
MVRLGFVRYSLMMKVSSFAKATADEISAIIHYEIGGNLVIVVETDVGRPPSLKLWRDEMARLLT